VKGLGSYRGVGSRQSPSVRPRNYVPHHQPMCHIMPTLLVGPVDAGLSLAEKGLCARDARATNFSDRDLPDAMPRHRKAIFKSETYFTVVTYLTS
jgi:hypothetical protein